MLQAVGAAVGSRWPGGDHADIQTSRVVRDVAVATRDGDGRGGAGGAGPVSAGGPHDRITTFVSSGVPRVDSHPTTPSGIARVAAAAPPMARTLPGLATETVRIAITATTSVVTAVAVSMAISRSRRRRSLITNAK